jgi:hypothetical protein
MIQRLRNLFVGWALLLTLLAMEVGISFLPLDRALRGLVLVPAILMVGVVATLFMELEREARVVRLFAVAGLVWTTILLILGSLDPMTRIVYPVQGWDTHLFEPTPQPKMASMQYLSSSVQRLERRCFL